jgi:glycine cleavage system H lipoate-binding protein
MNYIVTLTDTEKSAMEYVALNPQEWVENVVKERARIAIDEIVKIAVEKFLEINESIPGSKDEIVSQAYSRGWVNTVKYNEDNRVPLI